MPESYIPTELYLNEISEIDALLHFHTDFSAPSRLKQMRKFRTDLITKWLHQFGHSIFYHAVIGMDMPMGDSSGRPRALALPSQLSPHKLECP